MKKVLSIILLASLASCTAANDVEIERIKADKEIQISKQKTEQLKLQLKIEKEKNK